MFNAPKALLVLGSSFFAQCCLSWKDTGAQPAQPAVGNGANFLPCDHRHLFGPFGWCPLPLIVSLTLFGRVWRAHKEFFLFKTCGRVFGNVLHTWALEQVLTAWMYYAEQFLSPFSILQHQWSHSHPWSTKIIQPFYQLARNQPVKYFEGFSQLCRVVLVFCLATDVPVVQFARCSPASSSSPWTRQSRVSRFRWRRTQWQGSAPADWSETSWKRKRWSASDSNYGQLRFSTNHIITCPFQDKMKKDLENEIHLVLGRVLPHRPHDWQQLFRWYCPTSILQTIVRDR